MVRFHKKFLTHWRDAAAGRTGRYKEYERMRSAAKLESLAHARSEICYCASMLLSYEKSPDVLNRNVGTICLIDWLIELWRNVYFSFSVPEMRLCQLHIHKIYTGIAIHAVMGMWRHETGNRSVGWPIPSSLNYLNFLKMLHTRTHAIFLNKIIWRRSGWKHDNDQKFVQNFGQKIWSEALERPRRRWEDNIKNNLKGDFMIWTGFVWLRMGTIFEESCPENGNWNLGFIKGGEFLQCLSN